MRFAISLSLFSVERNEMTKPRLPGGTARGARLLSALLVLIAYCALPACSDKADRHHVITTVRVTESRGAALNASSARRFGFSGDHDHETAAKELPFDYEAPKGWEPRPPSQFRDLNFRVGGKNGADCYVTMLTGGGEAANINRWRGQMALEPLNEEELRALPRRPFLSTRGIYVEFQGAYQGMGDASAKDSTLLGMYAQFPRFAISVKMIGPTQLVLSSRGDFLRFCDSLRLRSEGAGTGSTGPGPEMAAVTESESGAIDWDIPAGWMLGEGSSMRLVTLDVEARPGAQCWVTVLTGEAGGVLPNLNRWRGEMGQEALSQAEVGALPTVEVFGRTASFLQVEGPVAEDGEPSYLFGVIAEQSGNRVFIKMVGKKQDLLAEQERFLEFCRSLRA